MKSFSELKEGLVLYTARESEEFWEFGTNDDAPNGLLKQYTKIKVHIEDKLEVIFRVLEGEFSGKLFMWYIDQGTTVQPGDLLTEDEYQLVSNKVVVDENNFENVIDEIELALVGIQKEKYIKLINFLMTPGRYWG